MRRGDLEIHLISDSFVREDPGGSFGLVPLKLYRRYVQPDAEHKIRMNLMCMLVRSRGKTILVDTGLGNPLSEREIRRWEPMRQGRGLLNHLAGLGIKAGEVDIVINTHLHADHCGGNTRPEGGQAAPAFPNSEYWVQRIEWAEASHPDARTKATYRARNFQPLMRMGRMRLLHGDTEVTDQVHLVVTPGHTRGHQSVLLTSGDWRGMFLAEMAPYAAHMEHTAWLAAYDVDPLRNLATKEHWQAWALETGAWLFFQHDPDRFVARLTKKEGKLTLEDIEEARPLIDAIPIPQPPSG